MTDSLWENEVGKIIDEFESGKIDRATAYRKLVPYFTGDESIISDHLDAVEEMK